MVVQKLNLDVELDITGYSVGWVLDTLDEHCEDYVRAKGDKKVVNLEANDVSDGKGYLSRVFIATVTFDDQSNFTFAMKVPTYEFIEENYLKMEGMNEESAQCTLKSLVQVHSVECDAMSFISSFKDFPAPKIYYIEKSNEGLPSGLEGREAPGVIMMSALDGASFTLVRSPTKEQCINFARDFATLHDHIAQSGEEKWKNKITSEMHWNQGVFDTVFVLLQKLEKLFPEVAEISNIMQSVDWVKYALYALKERPAELNAWTYVHGDAWTNNVIFKRNSDGSVGDEILAYIDYQLGFEGSPLFDIARFLTMCSDAEVRREAEPIVLKAYYNRLSKLFEKRGAKVPYTFEDVHELYDLAFFHQCTQAVLTISFMWKEFIKNSTEDVAEAQLAKLYLRNKFNLLDAAKVWKRRNMEKLRINKF